MKHSIASADVPVSCLFPFSTKFKLFGGTNERKCSAHHYPYPDVPLFFSLTGALHKTNKTLPAKLFLDFLLTEYIHKMFCRMKSRN
jgi:hypothetical protein